MSTAKAQKAQKNTGYQHSPCRKTIANKRDVAVKKMPRRGKALADWVLVGVIILIFDSSAFDS